MKLILVLLGAACLCAVNAQRFFPTYRQGPKQWALLVASSNGWLNYRHQADICHAYHVLRKNGFPAENIITMMYDDIANNTVNPLKGVILNRPGGPNVYEGVIKDYTGPEVNVQNVFNVLKGDKNAMKGIGSGRVIESGPDDHIFVNIVDHGSSGVLCFPNQEYMYAHDFNRVIKEMRREKRFTKMVIYLEACEGGSMFDNIIDDRGSVFVTTAAAPDESSYAYYCYNELNTCLGDFYSVVWMENMEQLQQTWSDHFVSLFKQYRHVRTAVNKSHVMVYGDFRLGFDRLSDYMGDSSIAAFRPYPFLDLSTQMKPPQIELGGPVNSRDVPLHILLSKLSKATDELERKAIADQLEDLQKKRDLVDATIDNIMTQIAGDDTRLYLDLTYTRQSLPGTSYPCYRSLIEEFNRVCYNTHRNPYLLSHFYKLSNICYWNIPASRVSYAFSQSCSEQHRNTMEAY